MEKWKDKHGNPPVDKSFYLDARQRIVYIEGYIIGSAAMFEVAGAKGLACREYYTEKDFHEFVHLDNPLDHLKQMEENLENTKWFVKGKLNRLQRLIDDR